jgi:hypothetical protein
VISTHTTCAAFSSTLAKRSRTKPWQARFMAEGVEGLTRDKTRKPGKEHVLPPPWRDCSYLAGRRYQLELGFLHVFPCSPFPDCS